MKLISICILVLAASSAFAQTGKITKVKGGKAIVDFGSQEVMEGQDVSIGSGASSKGGKNSGGGQQKRTHGLGYTASFTNSKPETGNATTAIGLNIDYLYNMGSFAIGGIFGMTSADNGTVKASTTNFGVQGRYQFTENKPGNEMIPFVGLGLKMGTTDPGGAKATTFFGQGGIDWFPWSQIFAVEANLLFESVSNEVGSAKSTSTNLGLGAGWRIWF